MRHCRKPRWWKPVPAKEEETRRILELIDQVAPGKQGEGQPEAERGGAGAAQDENGALSTGAATLCFRTRYQQTS